MPELRQWRCYAVLETSHGSKEILEYLGEDVGWGKGNWAP